MTQKEQFSTAADSHMQRAMEQLAMHSARVALARWTSGTPCVEMQIERALRPTNQARWHDRTHANFMAWVACGGFRADTDIITDMPQPAMPAAESSGLPATAISRVSDPQPA